MQNQPLLDFFKIMSNEQRLQIVGLLMKKPMKLAELVKELKLKPNEVADHLATLSMLDLISSRSDSGFQFNRKALYALNHSVLHRENITPVDGIADEATRKVLRRFFEGNRLKAIPEDPAKIEMLVEWLITLFDTNKRYAETEVNTILENHYEDYCTLRRMMIDAGLMRREKGIYWRVE